MTMKTIYDNYGDEVLLHDICYLIYQGFGVTAVHEFTRSFLSKQGIHVTWHTCVECGCEAPSYDKACLVCSSPTFGKAH